MNRTRTLLVASLAALTLGGCATTTTEALGLGPLEVVPEVDLERYMGTWFEIASYPQKFQEGCTGTTANYTLTEDGTVDVLNRCFLDSLDGEEDTANGRARKKDPDSVQGHFQVSFFGPFWADYLVIELDPDYQWAVVGHPSRDYLWILSRTPQLDADVLEARLTHLESIGYTRDRLTWTDQPKS